jgi:hypothetical protein
VTYRHAAAGRLPAGQARAVAARLAWSVPGLRACAFDGESGDLVLELSGNPGDIPELVERLIAAAAAERVTAGRVVRRNAPAQRDPPRHTEAPPDLALDLFEAVDRRLEALAVAAGARRRAYPALIGRETMARCDYLRSFPQNVYLVAELPHDWRVLERAALEPDPSVLAAPAEYLLSPAVCFHCYEELAGWKLGEPVLLTALGRCFRHEPACRTGGPRLREFSMREIALIGDAAFVADTRTALMDEVWGWFGSLGLEGRIETASDPFYAPADAMRAQYQLMAGAKLELVVRTHCGEEYALASFNDVADSLCRPFGISLDSGEPAHSGCVALGIERWVRALLTELGPASACAALEISKV